MTNSAPIYLDFAATTPVDPRVVTQMVACLSLENDFGNSASDHIYGQRAKAKIDQARAEVAQLIHSVPRNIVFTGSSTEATNLALKGVAHYYSDKGKHVITCKTEHRAVLDSCRRLESQGFSVTYLDVDKNGLVSVEDIKSAVREDTILLSIMHVNNETGLQQPIAEIGSYMRECNIFFHVDATQSVGKIPVDVQALPVDLLSFSAHKIYGPKGVGVLYIGDRPRVRLTPLIDGGGQERKLRAGTLATHQIVGMGAACSIASGEMKENFSHYQNLRHFFWSEIATLSDVRLNSQEALCIPNILNICFTALPEETLMKALQNFAFSRASACNSVSNEPSHVLQAMGLSKEQARCSLRFSFGRTTTLSEVERVVSVIKNLGSMT